MKRAFHLLSLGAALIAINACTSRNIDTEGALGPYDAQGNYIEEWADNPSKWQYPAGGASAVKTDVPKGDVTPLWGRSEPNVVLPPSDVSSKPQTKAQTAKVATAPPPPVSKPRSSSSTSRPSSSSSGSRTTAKKSTAKTSKPKPKPKPSPPRSVTIQKGDSLSKIASRNGTTVTELKRANGLKSDRIVAGKSLKLPPKKR